MQNLAGKLMGKVQNFQQTVSHSAITGEPSGRLLPSFGDTASFRIGLWPIQSQSDPEVAMGIATLLAFLLERWSSIRVYRLFIKDSGRIDHWNISQSQFSVDDWQLEDLDENIALWGMFETSNERWTLKLEVENDLAEAGEDSFVASLETNGLTEMVMKLPQIATSIAERLGIGDVDLTIPIYQSSNSEDSVLEIMLKEAFQWEINILQMLLGKTWSVDQQINDYSQQVQTYANDDLGYWMVANVGARLLSPFYAPLGESFAAFVVEYTIKHEMSNAYSIILALALHKLGHTLGAYDLLEVALETHPHDTPTYLMLAEFFIQHNELGSALDTYQRAIKAGAVTTNLYLKYAELLLLLDAGNIVLKVGARRTSSSQRTYLEDFILIDDSTSFRPLNWEAVQAYQSALQIEPNNTRVLHDLLLQLSDLQSPLFWSQFSQLLELDEKGDQVRDVVETLYNFDDISPAILLLNDIVKGHPDRVMIRLNLAVAYLLDERHEDARRELDQARKQADSSRINADIDRLMLSVDDPVFEARLSDITERVDAGTKLDVDDIEYLETVVEKAPQFPESYILLANAYVAWNEISDGLDVLLDGQKELPDDPDIAASLAHILWKSGESHLALDCLNKTLSKNPTHVPSLALAGRFLFEDQQENEARAFLSRAEAINPRHPILQQVKVFIGNNLDA